MIESKGFPFKPETLYAENNAVLKYLNSIETLVVWLKTGRVLEDTYGYKKFGTAGFQA